jgi:hypothetical protein
MFSKQQIAAGLSLASAWYEGWKIEDLDAEQLIEAIQKAPIAFCGRCNKDCPAVDAEGVPGQFLRVCGVCGFTLFIN